MTAMSKMPNTHRPHPRTRHPHHHPHHHHHYHDTTTGRSTIPFFPFAKRVRMLAVLSHVFINADMNGYLQVPPAGRRTGVPDCGGGGARACVWGGVAAG